MNIEQLTDIIRKYVDENTEITEKSILCDDLGLCSFDMLEIIVYLERMYKIVDFDKIHTGMTVRDLLDALK